MTYTNQNGKTVEYFEDKSADYVTADTDYDDAAKELAKYGEYYVVKLQTAEQLAKLDAFIKSEIYPFYNEQKEFIF